MKVQEYNYSTICQKNEMIKLPNTWDFDASKKLCHVVGGDLNVITNSQNQESVISLMEDTQCPYGMVVLNTQIQSNIFG